MTTSHSSSHDKSSAPRSFVKTLGVVCSSVLALFVVFFAITVPLGLKEQFLFAGISLALLLLFRRANSRRMTFVLGVLSLVVSTRYMYWRTTETLHFETYTGAFLGVGLYLAEVYAWLILLLGYLQTAWPLERKPVPLPDDPQEWPHVDVYIPTYNESLQVVADTVLAALSMDYPHDKMHVYLLDDGRRNEFKEFAATVGAEYITRNDNKFAKAGNLNHAMAKTKGEYICIFDCDHVPTRAFLQLTVGWLVRDRKLALVQTPHHFYSQEPFQRNIPNGRELPSEGELFYGSVQPGNDYWNAAFFCGSCAVIRRAAIEDIGGFARETVTEDAHTALKMQKLGWGTAYLNIPLAAGLATERLSLHVGQRIRWARGMTQILRLDNPLFGGKMTWAQRLCYLNAILHFQFPLPRLVFLTSPLAYLFLGQYVISASALLIAAYAIPHLIFSSVTNARLQGKHRHAFWGEVYEVVLTFHLLLPTLVTLVSPKRGKFNVTDKGELLDHSFFDWRLMRPHLVTAFLLLGGIVFGFARIYWPGWFDISLDTLLLNTAWSLFNLTLLCAAMAIGMESRQIRRDVRIEARLPVSLALADGRTLQSFTRDLSMGGMAVEWPENIDLPDDQLALVQIPCGPKMATFETLIASRDGIIASLQFSPMTLTKRRDLVMCVMGRADAWATRPDHTRETVLHSFSELLKVNTRFVGALVSARAALVSLLVAGTVSLIVFLSTNAFAATDALGLAPAISDNAPIGTQAPTTSTSETSVNNFDVDATQTAPAAIVAPAIRVVELSLKDIGAGSPVRLAGTNGEAGYPFTLRKNEVVTSASLTLSLAYSPSLLSGLSHLAVLVNDELVGTIKLTQARSGGINVEMPINPALFLSSNRLNLRFVGHYTTDCEDPLHSSLWAIVSNTLSKLRMTVQRLDMPPDLANLPAPFFDAGDMAPLSLPFVFASAPNDSELRAAASVASYFGKLASYRGFAFKPSYGVLPTGNAVVFVSVDEKIPGLALPVMSGPTLMVMVNPVDPSGRLLVIYGNEGDELRAAADTLSLGEVALSGTSARIQQPLLADHVPYDAPRWLPTGRIVPFAELKDSVSLQGAGIAPATLTANFRTAPDLFVWPSSGIPLAVHYRFPQGPWLNYESSRLDVSVNDTYLQSFKLANKHSYFDIPNVTQGDFVLDSKQVQLPPYLVFGQNQLQFYFNMKMVGGARCENKLPDNVHVGVDLDSSLDMRGVHHFAQMPNLAYFAGAGFPFTRMADLSDTTVILPKSPSESEVATFLGLMGRFGDATGTPATRVSVSHEADAEQLKSKDVLLIGTYAFSNALPHLMEPAPIAVSGSTVRINVSSPMMQMLARFVPLEGLGVEDGRKAADSLLLTTENLLTLTSFRSPFDDKRVVVSLLANNDADLPRLASALSERAINAQVHGDLSVLRADGVMSFSVGPTFWRGELPWLTWAQWYLSENPLLLALALIGAVFVLAWPIYSALRRRAERRLSGGGE